MIWRKLLPLTGLTMFLIGVTMLIEPVRSAYASPECDKKKASASVGSCGQPPDIPPARMYAQCSGQNRRDCNAQPFIWIHVEQNFPTECVASDGYNCNMPDQNCWQVIECEWDSATGECKEKAGSGGIWTKKPKRETVACQAPGE